MLLQVEKISGGYGKKIVCRDIDFSLGDGELLAVAGPNGCGKSTLFRLLLGFNPLSGGRVLLDGVPLTEFSPRQLAETMAYIPQNHNPVFSYTVLELVLMGRVSHFSAFSVPRAVDERKALEALERLGIAHLAGEDYTRLSGGQRQLALIARALAQEANILIMDEPASALDYANAGVIMDAVTELKRDGYLVLMSTHSMDAPFLCADKVLLLKDGRTFACGTPEATLTSANLEQVYGQPMDVVKVRDSTGADRTVCLPMRR